MSNNDVPAEKTGGHSNTSTNGGQQAAPGIPELPAKLRVHALAKLLGTSSREVLSALAELGEQARSAQSSITREVALRVAEALLPEPAEAGQAPAEVSVGDEADYEPAARTLTPVFAPPPTVFLPPTPTKAPPAAPRTEEAEPVAEQPAAPGAGDIDEGDGGGRRRRRRGRRGRGRGRGGQAEDEATEATEAAQVTEGAAGEQAAEAEEQPAEQAAESAEEAATNRRRRRRRRRKGSGEEEVGPREEDGVPTVVHVREARPETPSAEDEVRAVKGSTRLEAKRQRRRDGREAGRRRAPVLSEAEFLARREAVDRTMVVRERGEMTQIAVLEDGVLVEHFVTSAGTGSMVGNVYLGRVQNVLPSMEAAFVDIGRGRNAVLYAGEVDWDAAGLEGKARRIEQALKTGDSILVQVTKDPVGHKGARLTTQISLPGRFLVYVPGGGATGISRKLPDNERKRLKDILKRVVPDNAGVIIRTASEGISEEELGRDVRRLQAQWEVIKGKADQPNAAAPQLLYEEPDLLIKVVRDLFTEDFSELVVAGGQPWDTIEAYVRHVAPDLVPRLKRHVDNVDVFTVHRIDEQITKALDRKVWLPSGGYLVIDRTEAMTVIDVNTGKFTGSGGNLEETVTRNNLEAAEEIVRQLRLRDIGGIIVIDFIDMVLESNRDLVLRRLTECLGRDRTRHQVAEVTSLGLVQMTRKRVGTGLLEAFSSTCEHCRGRGVVVSTEPIQVNGGAKGGEGNGRRRGRGRGGAEPAAPAAEAAAATPEPRAAEQPEAEEPAAAEAAPAEPAAERAGRRRERRRSRRAQRPEAPAAATGEPAAEQPEAREPAAAEAVSAAGEPAPAESRSAARPEGASEPAASEAVAASASPAPAEEAAAEATAPTEAEPAEVAQATATERPAAEPVSSSAGAGRPEAQSAMNGHVPAEAADEQPSPGAARTEPAGQPVAATPHQPDQPPATVAVTTRTRRRRAAARPAGPPSTAHQG
ncbi:hypothetical protein GCM10012275_25650 [Longimycelium tulufanense]|uniref:Ribonuclease E n=1 Tax=Longimycelium tulufanense TaxID=907463 RepID=A0A8J3CB68_9PSEU|nr:translation initiation factor IF-2 N-terminal domain-containing protein [Longimycelium tulufanense]GGM53487.1 hypothetical protein GCM10012275_25650 [Longimycelium tulufanense]